MRLRTGKESFVLVIKYVDGPEEQEAFFHRMSKVRMNEGWVKCLHCDGSFLVLQHISYS